MSGLTKTFQVTGMTCKGCLKTVTSALQVLSPSVKVTLNPPEAVFKDEKVSVDNINAALKAHPKYKAEKYRVIHKTDIDDISEAGFFRTYYPLFLIAGFVSAVSFAGFDGRSFMGWMNNFMAGFFLVFSFFKLLDLQGFADAFSNYDIIAKRFPFYGFIYPFLELALGFAFLFRFMPFASNIFTVILMGLGSVGVIQAVLSGNKIQCACLGTVLNLPMSIITLIENGLMIAMALIALAHI